MADVVKVESIAPSTMPNDTIPLEFIQPAVTTTAPLGASTTEFPVINFSEPNEETMVSLVSKASRDWGLFRLINHKIPSETIEKIQEMGKAFFELPLDEREKYVKPADSKSPEGYGTKFSMDGVQFWLHSLGHIIWPLSARNFQFWPQSYREANEEYAMHLHGVVNKLLNTLSRGLGLKEHELKEAIGGEELIYLSKINRYSPCPTPDLAPGVTVHTNPNAITILLPTEMPGLQVFRDGHCYDVEYVPNTLIILIGDQLEIASNGEYKAGLHRGVISKEKIRYAWPTFVEPSDDKEVGPHPQLVTDENPAKYTAKTPGEYKYRKINKLPQ